MPSVESPRVTLGGFMIIKNPEKSKYELHVHKIAASGKEYLIWKLKPGKSKYFKEAGLIIRRYPLSTPKPKFTLRLRIRDSSLELDHVQKRQRARSNPRRNSRKKQYHESPGV